MKLTLDEALATVSDRLPKDVTEYINSSDDPKECIAEILDTDYNKELDWVYSVIE